MGGIKKDETERASILGGLIMVNHVSHELSAVYIRYLKNQVVRVCTILPLKHKIQSVYAHARRD